MMMVTDAGRLIRVPVDQARVTGRQAMGVTLFRVDKGEHVTSVFTVLEEETEDSDVPESPATGESMPDAPTLDDGRLDGGDTGEGPDDNDKPVPEEGSDG